MANTEQDTLPSPGNSAQLDSPPITIDHVRDLADELTWFYTRDWRIIVPNSQIAQALIRRSTRAALYTEDILADLTHGHRSALTQPNDASQVIQDPIPKTSVPTQPHLHNNSHEEEEEPPCVTSIPVSVDRVELYEFGTPHEHEHPLYKEHTLMHFCAAFYHEDEFIFARAHLQLLLTPTGALNWLAGSRSVPIDRNYLPLPYVPGGELFHLLGLGITQLIYTNQTELKMRMKQGQRLPADYKLVGMVLKNQVEAGPGLPTVHGERQKPSWIKDA